MYFPALLPTHRSLSSPLGGDPAEIGLVYALGPLGPIAGYLANHVSRARLIAFTGYFSSLTFLIYIVAPSWHWLAVARRL